LISETFVTITMNNVSTNKDRNLMKGAFPDYSKEINTRLLFSIYFACHFCQFLKEFMFKQSLSPSDCLSWYRQLNPGSGTISTDTKG